MGRMQTLLIPGGGGVFPLDWISTVAAAAYSVRKLRAGYAGSAIRVRRSSDNGENDFGFNGVHLDTVALLAYCNGGDGFVTTWYDQSGNTNHKTNSTVVEQPQIVSSGSLLTAGANNRPVLRFDGTDDWLDCPDHASMTSSGNGNHLHLVLDINASTLQTLARNRNLGAVGTLSGLALEITGGYYATGSSVYEDTSNNAILPSGSHAHPTAYAIISVDLGTTAWTIWHDGVDQGVGTAVGAGATPIGVVDGDNYATGAEPDGGTRPLDGDHSEEVLFNGSLSASERQLLLANTQRYFGL